MFVALKGLGRADHPHYDPLLQTAEELRSMKDKEGRSKPNYNTQVAVDDAYGVIVAADVNDETDDSGQLTPMVEQVIANCGEAPESVTADSQYNTGPDLAAMEKREIDCYLPDAGQNSAASAASEAAQEAWSRVRAGESLSDSQWDALPRNRRGMIDKSSFVYDKANDEYRCPAGETLVFLRTSCDKKKWGTAKRRQYGGCAACAGCPRAAVCCKHPEKGRVISRDQYEEHRERLRRRMATDRGRDIYKRRKHTVEPRIGHINMAALDERDPPEPQALACAVIPLAVLSRGFAPPRGLKPAAQKRDLALSY